MVVVVVAHATLLQSCDHCGRKNRNYGNYTNTPQRSPRACAVAADQHLSQQPGVETVPRAMMLLEHLHPPPDLGAVCRFLWADVSVCPHTHLLTCLYTCHLFMCISQSLYLSITSVHNIYHLPTWLSSTHCICLHTSLSNRTSICHLFICISHVSIIYVSSIIEASVYLAIICHISIHPSITFVLSFIHH